MGSWGKSNSKTDFEESAKTASSNSKHDKKAVLSNVNRPLADRPDYAVNKFEHGRGGGHGRGTGQWVPSWTSVTMFGGMYNEVQVKQVWTFLGEGDCGLGWKGAWPADPCIVRRGCPCMMRWLMASWVMDRCGQTDPTENITFTRLRWRTVKIPMYHRRSQFMFSCITQGESWMCLLSSIELVEFKFSVTSIFVDSRAGINLT